MKDSYEGVALLVAYFIVTIFAVAVIADMQTGRICEAIRSIEVHNTSNIRTPSVTILDGDWNVREEKEKWNEPIAK